MSTLIGQRERIAVEFELKEVEPELRKWLYGTMSLWLAATASAGMDGMTRSVP
jgi:hypothetical protein